MKDTAKRPQTQLYYRTKIAEAKRLLRSSLRESVDLAQVCDQVAVSKFHFSRIFMAFEGETIFEYLRRQLLLRVTSELIANPQKTVTALAFENGFESAPSLNKLFKKSLGSTPSEFRKMTPQVREKAILKLQDPKKGKAMKLDLTTEPEFRNRPDRDFLFYRTTGKYSEKAPVAWQVLIPELEKNKLAPPQVTEYLGVSHDDPKKVNENSLRYDAGVTVVKGIKPPKELELETLKGGKFAVFTYKGPTHLVWEAFDQIFAKWGAQHANDLRGGPCLEIYLNDPNVTKPEDLLTEIWIPCK